MKTQLESLYYAAGIVVALGLAFNIGKGIGEDTKTSEISAMTERLKQYESLSNFDLQTQLNNLIAVSDKLGEQTAIYDELARSRENLKKLSAQLEQKNEALIKADKQSHALKDGNEKLKTMLKESNTTIRNLTFEEEVVVVSEHGAKPLLNGELTIGIQNIYGSFLEAILNGTRYKFEGGSQKEVSVAGSIYRVTLVATNEDQNSASFHIRRVE